MFEDLKFKFLKGDALIRVILINAFIFIPLLVLKVVLVLLNSRPTFNYVMSYFEMPTKLDLLLLRPWTVIVYGFTQVDVLHFIFNMLGIYWFGGIIQEFIGEKRFVSIYVLGVIFGALVVLIAYNVFPYFNNTIEFLIGASGAVFALAVAAVTLLPKYTISFPIFGEIKLLYLVLLYLLISFASTIGQNAGGNIDHLGGAFLGFVFIKLLQKGYDLGKPINYITSLFNKKPKTKLRVSHRSEKPMKNNSEAPDQDEIDRILDKMNQKGGYNSLSQEEKEKLFKYSQK
ncbi:MAG: rhomboid family intramembrane serine protease [Cytophagales bacterium]